MFAIAVRDGDDLFLWIRLRRAASTDIYYVLPTGREHDPKWKKWNPHGSWHKNGALHHKSDDVKLQAELGQRPNAEFKGTKQIISLHITAQRLRAFGVHCDPLKFSDVMVIPAEIINQNTFTSVDGGEPGLQPLLMGGGEKILMQRVFNDAIPHITVTVYSYGTL